MHYNYNIGFIGHGMMCTRPIIIVCITMTCFYSIRSRLDRSVELPYRSLYSIPVG